MSVKRKKYAKASGRSGSCNEDKSYIRCYQHILRDCRRHAYVSEKPLINAITRIYLEIVRIMPQLVLLFIVFFGFTKLTGKNISAELSSIIVLSFWGTAEMADLVRGSR